MAKITTYYCDLCAAQVGEFSGTLYLHQNRKSEIAADTCKTCMEKVNAALKSRNFWKAVKDD